MADLRPDPRLPVSLLFFVVIFAPLAFGTVEPWSLAIMEATLLSAAVAALFAFRSVPLTTTARNLLLPVAVILCLGAVQSLRVLPVAAPGLPIVFSASREGLRDAMLLWCAYGLLAFSASILLVGKDRIRLFLWTVFLTGAFVAVMGIIQHHLNDDTMYFFRRVYWAGKFFGPFYNRNHAATFMSMSLLIGLGLFLSLMERWRKDEGLGEVADSLVMQGLILFLIGVLLYAVVLTQSRGALFSLVVAASCLAAASRRREQLGYWPLVCGITLGAAIAFLVYRFRSDYRLDPAFLARSLASRWCIYRSALEAFADSPWTGIGLGGFKAAFRYHQDPSIPGIVEHAHSDPLELLVETGVLGAGALASGLFLQARAALKAISASRSKETRGLLAGAGAAALCFLLHGAVDFPFQIPGIAAVFICLLVCLDAGEPETRELRITRGGRMAACLLALVLAVPMAKPTAGYWYAFRAKRAPEAAQPAYWTLALSWDPRADYRYRLMKSYYQLAVRTPPASTVLLRLALECSEEAMRLESQDVRILQLRGYILTALGRPDDGSMFLPAKT